MSVSFHVGDKFYGIGAGSFLHCFFSTIAYRLENKKWGSKYPVIMKELYWGTLPYQQAQKALEELEQIKKGLSERPYQDVIWDFEDLSKQSPWGDNVSAEVTNLGEYFVTNDGEYLLDSLENTLMHSKEVKEDILIT